MIRWSLIFASFSSLAIHAFIDISRAPLFPEVIKDMGLTDSQAGLFFGATSLFMMLATLSSGKFMRVLGTTKALLLYMLVMIAGQFMFASASTYHYLVLGSMLLGLGFGGMGVCQNVLVTEASPVEHQRKLFGGLHSMYAFAALMAPVLVTYFFTRGVYWRDFAYTVAFIPCVLWLLYLIMLGTQKSSKKSIPSATPLTERNKANTNLKIKIFLPMTLSFYVLAELILSIWLVMYLQKHFNYTTEQSGLALSLFFGALLSGRLLMSVFHLPFANFKILKFSLMGGLVFVALGLFVNPWLICVSGVFMSPVFPTVMAYLAENVGDNTRVIMPICIGGMSLTIMFGHNLAGFLSDSYGIQWSISLALIGLFLSVLALLKTETLFKMNQNIEN
ncbi:MAG: sugar MFS transporter [Bdellovibrionales bacterium]